MPARYLLPAITLVAAWPATAQAGCDAETPPGPRIEACTLRIEADLAPVSALAARLARGEAYRALGRHAEAVEDFSAALRMAPGDGRAHLGRALGQCALGRVAEALADARAAATEGFLRTEEAADLLRAEGFSGEAGALDAWIVSGCPR